MKTPLILTVCCSLLALSGCAGMGVNRPAATAAAGGTASPSVSFMEADTDGDARITPHEYDVKFARDGAQRESFQAADTNRDGVLTLDEWQTLVSPPRVSTRPGAPRASEYDRGR